MDTSVREATQTPTVVPAAGGRALANRWLVVAVAVLSVALAGVAAWGVGRGDDGGDAHPAHPALPALPAEVDRLHDAVEQAWNDADGEAMAALFTEDGVLDQYLLSPLYESPSFLSEGRTQIRDDVNAYRGRNMRTWRTGEPIVGGLFSSVAIAWESGARGGSGIVVLERTDDGLIANQWVFSLEAQQPGPG